MRIEFLLLIQLKCKMRKIIPENEAVKDLHQYLLGCVAPRPIAFVSTVDEKGRNNLAPYSFFNAFSSNPPIVVFSSNRRVADNTTKDTLHNIRATGECVINMVSHDIVRQMALTSVGFDAGVSEFEQSGLTPIDSDIVKPKRVKESPAHLECKLREIITLGKHGGAGHLIICDVVRMHIDEAVLDDNNRINPHKIDLMGRMGRAYYVRASGESIETIVQSVVGPVVGYPSLPSSIRESEIYTANDIGLLASAERMPSDEELKSLELEEDVISCTKSALPRASLQRLSKIYLHRNERIKGLGIGLIADRF